MNQQLYQLLFLKEVNVIPSNSLNVEPVHFTDTAKYVDQTSYSNAKSQSDTKLWRKQYDKEMNYLIAHNVFTVVDQLVNQNHLGIAS